MNLAESLAHINFADPQIWVSLLTLTFLEIVLGVDNIIFISIISDKLPKEHQRRARNIGLAAAMLFRIGLLLAINWIIGLKEPVLTLDWYTDDLTGAALQLSWKDIILLAGGVFLVGKSTVEIHHKMQVNIETETEKEGKSKKNGKGAALVGIILQIILIDAVFSIDSILTAVGLVDNVVIMIVAVMISIAIMMLFAGTVSRIINENPTLQMLALSFLVVIGVILVAEGIHEHVSKNIIYSMLAFSLTVELLNINLRKRQARQNNQTTV